VYAGCFRVGPGSVDVLVPPSATRLGEVLSSSVPEGAIFAGDGAFRHAAAIGRRGWRVVPPPVGLPTAEGLARLFTLMPGPPVDNARAWEPEYLRPWRAGAAGP